MTADQHLLVLTSPPASGKTFWINSFHQELKGERLLIISPLRALADECRQRWGEEMDFMTPEEWLMKKSSHRIVIFDEFHLFFYWGDSFRPLMWEVFFALSLHAEAVILLTATLSDDMRAEISRFSLHFDQVLWINHGNQHLKYVPARYIKAPDRHWLLAQIKGAKKKTSVKLIFCQYRQEVYQMEKELNSLGFTCLSCVGGESKFMAAKLQANPHPDFIISTTVLSHGVNLPQIKEIYFTYQVKNIDFWIQMVARGGRRGEKFVVFALEKPFTLKWNPLRNLVDIAWLSIKQKCSRHSLWGAPFDFG